jgi:hypothetical protein
MTAANMVACVAALKARVVSILSYSSAVVTSGRRAPTARGATWAWIERRGESSVSNYGGDARLQEYTLHAHLYRKAVDLQEEDTLDAALQADAEALKDACQNRGIGTWTTLTGITASRAATVTRDSEAASREEQEAVIEVVYPIHEAAT